MAATTVAKTREILYPAQKKKEMEVKKSNSNR